VEVGRWVREAGLGWFEGKEEKEDVGHIGEGWI
jgi:hypothetical protein